MTERIRDGKIQTVMLPTKERTAKRVEGESDVVIEETNRGGMLMRSFSFPLDFYLRMELISQTQWLAGDEYNRVWTEGSLPAFVQFRYEEGQGGGRNPNPDPAGAASKEWRDAQMAIRDVPHRRIAYHVCCEGLSLSVSKQFTSARTARRHGMPMLQAALDDLAKHFKI